MSDDEVLSAFHQGQILCDGLKLVRQDLCDWINVIFPTPVINPESFLQDLYSGVILCDLLMHLEKHIGDDQLPNWWCKQLPKPPRRRQSSAQIFEARDNVSKFLDWCKMSGFPNTILFETNGLINKDEEKNVVLTLLRLTEKLSSLDHIELPEFAKYYRQITQGEPGGGCMGGPMAISVFGNLESAVGIGGELDDSSISNDSGFNSPGGPRSRSLSVNQVTAKSPRPSSGSTSNKKSPRKPKEDSFLEKSKPSMGNVRSIKSANKQPMSNANKCKYRARSQSFCNLSPVDVKMQDARRQCCCESKFEIEKLYMYEGKYKFGRNIRFVRVFRGTVVIRVGGGWETLSEYVHKNDPCQKQQKNQQVNSTLAQKTRQKSICDATRSDMLSQKTQSHFEKRAFIKVKKEQK